MALIEKPNTFTDGTAAEASEVNDNFDEIYDEFNGSINSANLSSDAVATGNIADDAVTTPKIDDAAVTTDKVSNNAITSAKLAVALSNSSPGSLADLTATPTAIASVSLPAGTWYLMGKANLDIATTQRVVTSARLRNTTDGATLDTTQGEAEFVSGTLNAEIPFTCAAIVTIASTKTVEFQFSVDDTTGTAAVENGKLFAIPVGV